MRTVLIAPAFTITTWPPPEAVLTVAVASPASGGVMKRETKAVAPSAATDTWRALAPTANVPVMPKVLVLIFSSWPVPSSATSALPEAAAIAMP